MNVSNLQIAAKLGKALTNVDLALNSVQEFEKAYVVDSLFGDTTDRTQLYSLHISQYGDGSGLQVDLTGCGVGLGVLEGCKDLLLKKKAEILERIAAL